jgi:hypothetical protein
MREKVPMLRKPEPAYPQLDGEWIVKNPRLLNDERDSASAPPKGAAR